MRRCFRICVAEDVAHRAAATPARSTRTPTGSTQHIACARKIQVAPALVKMTRPRTLPLASQD